MGKLVANFRQNGASEALIQYEDSTKCIHTLGDHAGGGNHWRTPRRRDL